MKFSRSTKDVQQPEVTITLDNDSTGPFHPGSRVSGNVSFPHDPHKPIQKAEVVLFGRATTRIPRKGATNGELTLLQFDDTAEIFRSVQHVPLDRDVKNDTGENYEWRFDLRFPETTSLTSKSPYADESRFEGAYTLETHALPPSFSMVASASTFAVVGYHVQARLQFEGEEEPLIAQFPEQLVLLPRAAQQQPRQPIEVVKSAVRFSSPHLLPSASGSRSSFRILGGNFSSKAPTVNVGLRANLPTTLATGASFRLSTTVEISSPSSSNITIPTINVRVKTLRLFQRTYLRALRVAPGGTGHRVVETKCEEAVLLNTLPPSIDVSRQHATDGVEKVWTYPAEFESRVPGTTCPCFSTVNINQGFRTDLVLEVTICGKAVEFVVEVPEIVVVAPS
ncbi:uncharacterized protein LTR77_004913 [Saxophila tyrrhenica]|uniref:Arrestin-like N-terminal domain-containing protein n=1 Tax=Saxophila tyrrhenica TaxID=1690608 RepID=A0AAV9PBF0_9PEZI|nr:hypothetical protein LTR77_004913 [Saxophila tyrrhenica]